MGQAAVPKDRSLSKSHTTFTNQCLCYVAEQADVLNLKYRSALKLDSERFSCDLNPATLGILHEIGRVLAPNAAALRAEGCKLDV